MVAAVPFFNIVEEDEDDDIELDMQIKCKMLLKIDFS